MSDIKQKSSEIGWPDGRFRIFAVVLSGMVALLILLGLLVVGQAELTPVTGVVFVVLTALLEPSKQPHLKDRLAGLILGEGAFLTDYAFVWRERSVTVLVENEDGDAAIVREHELTNRDERNIRNRSHHFAFSKEHTVGDPGIRRSGDHFVRCDNDGDPLRTETIARSENYLEFIVNFDSSVEPGETYCYEIGLDNVVQAYPHADDSHTWQLRTYTTVENFDITIVYQFDASIQEASLKNVQTSEDICSVDVDSTTSQITAEVEQLAPGHYELEWIPE